MGYARQYKVLVRPGGRLPINIIVGSGFYGRESGPRTEVEATVLGDAVEGLVVEFSRAVSGREPNYLWNGFTDAAGQVSLGISSPRQVSGYYRARARATPMGRSWAGGAAFRSIRTGARCWS